MKFSFLSPDQNELIVLQKDYLEDMSDVKEAINDFFLYKENTFTDVTLPEKYKNWKIFIGNYTNMSVTLISFNCYSEQTISDILCI